MNDQNRNHERSSWSNILLGLGLALMLATAAYFSGLQMGTAAAAVPSENMPAGIFSSFFSKATTPDTAVNLDEFWRVWNLMEEKYVAASTADAVTPGDRLNGAIQGMVRSYGDPYSVFLPPSDAEQFSEDIAGNFGGVGMEVGLRNGVITIISPLPGTPAEKAGLLASDIIVTIDSISTEDMSIDEAVNLIRGEKGTEVALEIYREGTFALLNISVTRDTINIPTVETEQQEDVFIISLYSFNALAERRMAEALNEYQKSGTNKLIIDLRGNPGGYLQSAVAISSYFLPAGEVIVREQFSEGATEEVYRSSGKTLGQSTPEELVVLINGGSASASEIVAGALSQRGGATLIGETSFGKGSVQELVNLPNGSSLKVTIARWLTPDGTSISKGGLVPDISIKRSVEQMQANEDPQLAAALRYVRGDKLIASESDTSIFTE